MKNGLLDHAVHHVWNAQVSHAAIRLGNGLPSSRARAVSPLQELLSEGRPMVPKALEELVQCDAVRARGSAVRFDLLPSHFKISLVNNSFYQFIIWSRVQGWLLLGRRDRLPPLRLGWTTGVLFLVTREAEFTFVERTVRGHGWFFLGSDVRPFPSSLDSKGRYYGFC